MRKLVAFDIEKAKEIGEHIGINWENSEFGPEDLAVGIDVEFEHGTVDTETDVTGDDVQDTAKIAWAHLKESPFYYGELSKMEHELNKEATRFLASMCKLNK